MPRSNLNNGGPRPTPTYFAWYATLWSANSVPAGSPPRRNRSRSRVRVASICVPSSLAVTDLDPDQAEGLWYGMRSWIDEGFKLLKRGGWQWPATRMTDPDRVERLLLVLAVATRYVLAVGREADEAEFAGATIPEPAGQSAPSATGRPLASGAAWEGTGAAPRWGAAEGSSPRAAAAADRDEAAPGQHLPSRLGGIDERADRRSCVAETLMETRSLVGSTVRDQGVAPPAPTPIPQNPSL